ncbi:MAG TPA: FAD-dependent oxidoreductase, partial [Mycoplana sp.]|nr:FAD-dependent oxidoreductase [Mycoplana sp.]
SLAADQIFKAIGQTFDPIGVSNLQLEGGRIAVDAEGRTSVARVWAGGDCVKAGEDLTVTSVAQGRDAAESINRTLAAGARPSVAVA